MKEGNLLCKINTIRLWKTSGADGFGFGRLRGGRLRGGRLRGGRLRGGRLRGARLRCGRLRGGRLRGGRLRVRKTSRRKTSGVEDFGCGRLRGGRLPYKYPHKKNGFQMNESRKYFSENMYSNFFLEP
jgi:hypothetical protein